MRQTFLLFAASLPLAAATPPRELLTRPPAEMVEVKITNPCSIRGVYFSCQIKDNNSSRAISERTSDTFTVPKGAKMSVYVMNIRTMQLGTADCKGQVFTAPCSK